MGLDSLTTRRHFQLRFRFRSRMYAVKLSTALAFILGTATPHPVTAITAATMVAATDTPMPTTMVAIIHPTDTGGKRRQT